MVNMFLPKSELYVPRKKLTTISLALFLHFSGCVPFPLPGLKIRSYAAIQWMMYCVNQVDGKFNHWLVVWNMFYIPMYWE